MAGKRAQPISILKARGRKHLTKAEIRHREDSEIKIGENRLRCPQFVQNDVLAYVKWKEIAKIYKDIDLVTSSDIGILARYCVTFSEYLALLRHREIIAQIEFTTEEEAVAMDEFKSQIGANGATILWKKLNFTISTDGVSRIDKAINAKMDMLIKMEDRLFLNPLAKIKNIPKKEKERKDPNADLFG